MFSNSFLVRALLVLTPLLTAFAQRAHAIRQGVCVQVYTTAKDTELRMTLSDRVPLLPAQQTPESDTAVFVNPELRYQTLLGIGGAITDASAEVYAGLEKSVQQELMQAYFDEEQGYSLIRTPIHSCDFSRESFTYIEEGDEDLRTFDVAHDREFRIPMIRDAIATAGGKLTTCASPWSAPAFMKDTGNMLRGGRLLPRYRQAWAHYFAKFIEAYEAEGVPIWGVTIQNEPMATQTWESMLYTAEEERDFLRDYLGPTLERAGFGDRKIIVWDHNRDLVTNRAHTILGDPEAAKYVWGVGFHWYETWTGGDPMYGNVAEVKAAYPDVQVLATEACVERFDASRYQHWPNAERYGDALVNDFNAGAVGWIDWNILLDDQGGPNHVGNFCFAPVHASEGRLIFTPSYHYLGHFAKFMRPGAQRVSAVSSRSVLQTTSFVNTDHRLATVVLNLSDDVVAYRYHVGSQEATVTIPARAIQTLVSDLGEPVGWQTDFFDDFDSFNPENWQDQRIWVNNEQQCYVPDNQYGTREVSGGSIKLKVVDVGEELPCDNLSKSGKPHPETRYVAGRICSKNRKEFIQGKWTARLRVWNSGQKSMFPAWWLLGARNNESPVQEPDEDVPWPLEGSGEIDIFEHHGDHQHEHFTTGAIRSLGLDQGDWQTLRTNIPSTLGEYHEYSVEWAGPDLVYRVDGKEVHRNPGEGDRYPEPMFAILNFAKITDSPMTSGEWVMEVDWVKHESWNPSIVFQDPKAPTHLQLLEGGTEVTLHWDSLASQDVRYNVYRSSQSNERGERIAFGLKENHFAEAAPRKGVAHYYSVSASVGCIESRRSEIVHTALPALALPGRIEAENFVAMEGLQLEVCGDKGGGQNLGYFDPGDFIEYKVRVAEAGEYTFDYRVASEPGSEGFEIVIDERVLDTQRVAATGGWQDYVTQSSSPVTLEAGEFTLRIRPIGTHWNLNWLEVRR